MSKYTYIAILQWRARNKNAHSVLHYIFAIDNDINYTKKII